MSIFSRRSGNLLFAASCVILVGIVGFMWIIPLIKEKNFSSFLHNIQNSASLQGATLSVTAKREGDDDFLVEFQSEKRVHPGSNFKLLTAAASLAKLTPEFFFSTRLYEKRHKNGQRDRAPASVARSTRDLVLVGSGDPSFRETDFAEFAEAVRSTGFVSGNIYYDDRAFSGEPFGPGWAEDWQVQYFGVKQTGLQIHDNILEIRGGMDEASGRFVIETKPLPNYKPLVDRMSYFTNPNDLKRPVIAHMEEDGTVILEGDTMKDLPFRTSATLRNPSEVTANVLKQELIKLGLARSDTRIFPQQNDDIGTLLYDHHSAPLRDIVTAMLTFSKNNYAEALIRTLGKEIEGEGSQAKGVAALRDFLDEAGVPEESVQAFDGSGLSPSTRVTGKAILALFEYIDQQPWRDIFWTALPESKIDGTLKYRFEKAELTHPVIAKTGTHEFSSSLSGKIVRDGPDILFSVHIYNHPFTTEESVAYIIPKIDAIVAALDKQF